MTSDELRIILDTDLPLMLELGCNDGSDSARFLATFSGIELHCFEPDPRAIAKFRARIDDRRCTLHECAIASADGDITFWQSNGDGASWNWDQSGSIHEPTGHYQAWPSITFPSQSVVKTRSLDSWAREVIPQRTVDLIWADIQGAEHDLILGGRETLTMTRFLYSEFYDFPMYEGQRLLRELLELLGNDWELQWIRYDNFLATNRSLAKG